MKRFFKKAAALAAAALVSGSVMTAGAVPYQSYLYDPYEEAVYAPDAYVPQRVVHSQDIGAGDMREPTDIARDGEGNFYIVDSLNNRIIVTDPGFQLLRVIDKLDDNGRAEEMNKPRNIFIDQDGLLYVSDYNNKRVLVMDREGRIRRIIGKPDDPIYPQDKDFAPMDLVVTSTGLLYVIADGIYQGAVVFDETGEFDGFFGSNQVEPTLEVMMQYVWKQFATKEQRDKMQRYVPVQYSALCIDSEDFIYATVASAEEPANRLKKLNAQGTNILASTDDTPLCFGDPQTYTYQGEESTTILQAVDVIDDKIITVLDRRGKKVFQYSQEGKLVTVFGGEGNFDGMFADPVALCAYEDKVVVLDTQKANITVFSMTEYGRLIHEAINIYADGLYAQSVDCWKEVLKYNSGSTIANLGYGKAMYQLGRYEEAMAYFEKANAKSAYSDAYKEYRKIRVREHFSLYAGTAAAVFVLLVVWVKGKLYRRIRERVRAGRRGKKD